MPIIDAPLSTETRDRYLTYALSVVSGRALPDVRDGLKPVQRRILYAMLQQLNLKPDHTYRKSAAVVGEVLARFHPHGDTACYEAMVRMAQDFSLRYPLVDGQGNFGSLDGDSAAAYRYTEAKLRPLALEVIGEINEETVAFRDNFDATIQEPYVLPSRVPNLLINGASGIAVGMATSIPPHNLKDVVKALIELSNDSELSNAKLAGIVKAPDFPTGCAILNTKKELSDIYQSGRGSIRMRGDWTEEESARGKKFIVVTSIPYGVNKAQLVEKIANLIIDKKVPQLVDVRDESTSEIRVVLELAPGAEAEVAMAFVFKHTPLESNFPVNLTALVPTENGVSCRPELLSLKDCLRHFLSFREEVVQKRLQFERKKLCERMHILEGLVAIYDALDVALAIVRKSTGRSDAAEKLRARFKLSEIQAYAVVDMRIYQLSKTTIDEIREELAAKQKRVKEIDAILKSKAKISEIVRKDLEAVADKYGDKRLSKLVTDNVDLEFRAEDYVVNEDVFAIVTADSWIKRIRQNNELDSTRLREGDTILRAHPLSTLDSVVFFTNHGNVYSVKVSDFPSSSGYGDPIQKLLKFKDGEKIVECYGMKASGKNEGQLHVQDGKHVLLISQQGTGFILKLEGLADIKRNGKRAMKLRDGDELGALCIVDPDKDKQVSLFSSDGAGLRIKVNEIPVRDTPAVGVALLSVREHERTVGVVAHSRNTTVKLILQTGKTKEIRTDDVLSGHRALKGNKVISRDEIKRVELLTQLELFNG